MYATLPDSYLFGVSFALFGVNTIVDFFETVLWIDFWILFLRMCWIRVIYELFFFCFYILSFFFFFILMREISCNHILSHFISIFRIKKKKKRKSRLLHVIKIVVKLALNRLWLNFGRVSMCTYLIKLFTNVQSCSS